jgi:hypothetical protein
MPGKDTGFIYRLFKIRALGSLMITVLLASGAWAETVDKSYAVHAGSYRNSNQALGLLGDMRVDGFDCRSQKVGSLTSVLCGDFKSSSDAERLRRSLKKEGYVGARLVDDSYRKASGLESFSAVQVGSFSKKENAVKVTSDLKGKGYECRSSRVDGLHKVYCGKFSSSKDSAKLRKELNQSGFARAFVVSLSEWPFFINVPPPVVSAKPVNKPSSGPAPTPVKKALPLPVPERLFKDSKVAAVPVPVEIPAKKVSRKPKGQKKGINGSIFGKAGGHFHPFVSVINYYSDNIYSSDQNKVSDLTTVTSGGIWISAPGTRKPMVESSSGSLPGGTQKSSFIKEMKRPYQAYLLYKIDSENYLEHDSGDFVNHKGEALFALNSDAGHRFEIIGITQVSHDSKGEQPTEELAAFTSQRFDVSALATLGSKLRLRADISQFTIDYDKDLFMAKEHEDISYAGYIYFKFMPKTSIFLEYAVTKLDYDEQFALDSKETDYMVGLQWDITGDTTGSIKAGYSTREFDAAARNKESGVKLIGDMDFKVSDKTNVGLDVSRVRKEAGIPSVDFLITQGIRASIKSKPLAKWSWNGSVSYEQTEYVGQGIDRNDNLISGRLSVNFQLQKWLGLLAGVSREQKTSSETSVEYSTNTVHFGVSASF